MPSRAEMIAALRERDAAASPAPTQREQMIATLRQRDDEKLAGITKTDSATRGAVQGATLGFADEISGGVEALWNKAKGDPTAFGELYAKHRDESRANFETAQKANPKSYLAGEVGAAIGTAFVPGMALAKGAGLAKVAGQAALMGGAAGAGYSNKETAGEVLADTAKGAAIGGLLGAGAHVAAPYASKLASKISGKAKEQAERFAARALGAERGTIKSIGEKKVLAAGRQALDEGVITSLGNTDDMIARNAAAKAKGGGKMEQVYNAIDDKGASTFNPLEVATKVDDKIGDFYRSPINRGETKQLENTLESILMRSDKTGAKNITMKEAQILKEELGKVANWKSNLSPTDKEKMARDAYKVVSEAIDSSAERGAKSVGADGLLETLKEGKKIYGNSKTAERLLENKSAREKGNQILGLTGNLDLLGATGYGGVTGDWETAGAMVLAKRGLQKYGAQIAARGLDKVAKGLAKTPAAIEAASRVVAPLQRAKGGSVRPTLPKSMPGAGENEKAPEPSAPSKGPEKWANDGIEKLREHGADAEELKKLKETAAGRKILVAASDLKPGSKAMAKLAERIS